VAAGPPDQIEQAYAVQGMAGAGGALDSLGPLALSLSMNQQQWSMVGGHLFSIQTMSGAQLHVSPGGPGSPGVYHLVSDTAGDV
jgi:CUG-BP- and ETR3-like factor